MSESVESQVADEAEANAATDRGIAGLRHQVRDPGNAYGCGPELLGMVVGAAYGGAAWALGQGSLGTAIGWSMLVPIAAIFLGGAMGSNDSLNRTPQRWGWLVTYLAAGAYWIWRLDPPTAALAVAAASLAAIPAGDALAARAQRHTLKQWGLTRADLPAVEALPKTLTPEVETLVDQAIRNYRGLHDAVAAEPSPPPALDQLLHDARDTLARLLRTAGRHPQHPPPGDLDRMRDLALALRQALDAVDAWAATDDDTGAAALRRSTDELQRLSGSLDDLQHELRS